MHPPPPVKLLSSGNPQIPKGDGDGPVQAYLDAMPGWKRALGHRVDGLVSGFLPDVRKAVRWNTPLYGKEDGWFLAMYCYTRHVQITFFRGTDLVPVPPVSSKVEGVRYVNLGQEDVLDEALMTGWLEQAIKLPGAKLW